MILRDSFTVEPWDLRETHLDLDLLAQSESVFALANGHVGWQPTSTRASRTACRGPISTTSLSCGRCLPAGRQYAGRAQGGY